MSTNASPTAIPSRMGRRRKRGDSNNMLSEEDTTIREAAMSHTRSSMMPRQPPAHYKSTKSLHHRAVLVVVGFLSAALLLTPSSDAFVLQQQQPQHYSAHHRTHQHSIQRVLPHKKNRNDKRQSLLLQQSSLVLERPVAVPLLSRDKDFRLSFLPRNQQGEQHGLISIAPTIRTDTVNENHHAVLTGTMVPPLDATTTRTTALQKRNTLSSTLNLWKRRLVTRQDWKHLHKITGCIFLLASWGLTGYALRDLWANGWTLPVNRHGTPFAVLLYTLLASSVVQSQSSISMACRHRQGQPAVRNTFLCNAAVAILGSVSAVWSSPWYPACCNGLVSQLFYVVMDVIGLIGMADNLVRLKSLIASRQVTKHSAANRDGITTTTPLLSRRQYWQDVFVYMMPILIGAPFFVAIGWQFGICHDRTFYLRLLQQQTQVHLPAGAVYGMVMVAMGASYSSLIVTLRDKKLISKRTEGLSLTVVMLCLIGSLYQALRDPGTIRMLMGLL